MVGFVLLFQRYKMSPLLHLLRRYQPYASISESIVASGVSLGDGGYNPFDPSRFLFSRPRIEGHPRIGLPGRGMGAVMVEPTASTYPTGAIFYNDGGTLDTVDPTACEYLNARARPHC